MRKPTKILIAALIVPAALLYLGFGIKTGKVAPKHAIVLIDTEHDTYFAPPCVSKSKALSLQRSTIQVARESNLRPDEGCKNSGAFTQPGRSMSGKLLQNLGILQPPESRWNEDGSWKW